MNIYVRKTRGMLDSLGLVRRHRASWLGSFLTGAGFGVVAGAVLAALLTPTNGQEMRKLVRSKAKQVANRVEKETSKLQAVSPNGAGEGLPS